ncbi:MAG: glutamate synthase subunit beta [Candidatus Kaelpia aquatica]|nr:glutamate synthase subunit beta [Candidatus Kaelpia aquatica]
MGDIRGFLKRGRKDLGCRNVSERVEDFNNVYLPPSKDSSMEQASRCMDCATPFCHWACPLGNYIPEWNDYLFKGNWREALKLLDATNNMPEITGRLCPALCEYSCVLGLNSDAISIRDNELSIIEAGFKEGLIAPHIIEDRTNKNVAIIGSGPAGLSCAAQLNRAGHNVTVFERDNKIGGILRYGIPDFKLEKEILDRRIKIWEEEGIDFKVNIEVGEDYSAEELLEDFDAVCLACGSRVPRDLNIKGRELRGIYFAMDYLIQANYIASKETIDKDDCINVKDKKVVVIGGGDTGADCVGTSHRNGAKSVIQIEVMPKPPECRGDNEPWPLYPTLFKTSTSHEEGGQREWSVLTKKFLGRDGAINKISCVKIEFEKESENSCPSMREIPGSEFEIEADIVILAIGFLHTEKSTLLSKLSIVFDERGNVKTDDCYMTSAKNIFSAGDMRIGQSLVAWAISEGRKAAYSMDKYLMGDSNLAVM